VQAIGEHLREHLDGRVRNWQERAFSPREDVLLRTVNSDANDVALFNDLDPFTLGRKQDQVIDLITETAHDAFQLDEVEHEPGVLPERAFDGDFGPVVVAVQPLAAVAGEGDEVRRGEDEIGLRAVRRRWRLS
jgi:hypothetical protein